MRRVVFLFTALLPLLLAGSGMAGELSVLRVAAPERQPYFFRVQGEPAGLEADLLEELGRELRLDVEFVSCDGDCLKLLEQGKADLATGMADRPGLSARVLFVRPAYATAGDRVLYRLSEAAPVTGQLRLRGRKLGVLRDAPLPPEVASDHLIPLIRQDGAARLMKLLLAGVVDLVLLHEPVGDAVLRALHLERRIVKCDYRFPGGEPLFLAFSLRSKQLARAGELEGRLRGMVDSGRLRELQQRHLSGAETD